MASRIRFAPVVSPPPLGWRALLDWSRRSADRARQRRRLAEMTDRELKDIGLSRADAEGEAAKTWLRCILSR